MNGPHIKFNTKEAADIECIGYIFNIKPVVDRHHPPEVCDIITRSQAY